MIELVEWLTLVTTLPARNTAARMRLWRAIKALGCATLRDGVYLLPAREDTDAALRALADEVRAADGSAEVLHIAADGAQDDAFRQLVRPQRRLWRVDRCNPRRQRPMKKPCGD